MSADDIPSSVASSRLGPPERGRVVSDTTAPAGWYTDPYRPGQWRYFDGTGWTPHTQPGGVATATSGTTIVAPAHARAAGQRKPVPRRIASATSRSTSSG
jgi:hypothetical protein